MKRIISIILLFFYLFSFQSPIYATGSTKDDSIYAKLQKDEKTTSKPEKKVSSSKKTTDSQSSSLFLLFFKFIFYFLLVIGLLYMVLQFLSKRNRLLPSNGPILSLGGQPLGNNKSLQVMLIGQTIYIVGVGDTVTLMRTISEGEEYQSLLESFENHSQSENLTQKWFPIDAKKLWNSFFRKDLQSMQNEIGSYENQGQYKRISKKWLPMDTKTMWNSIFGKDLQNMQHDLDSFEDQVKGNVPSQKWLPKNSNKNWNSVFHKHLQKIQQENDEE